MSLVGTRPPTVDEWELYEPHHRARMSFRPGLTGMWQVSGRSNITDFEEVVKLDTQYMTKYLNSLKGEKATVGDGYKKYFKLEIYEDDGTIICARERTEVIREEIDLYVFSGECQCEYRKFAVSSIAKDKNTRIFYKICVKCLLYLCVIFGKII